MDAGCRDVRADAECRAARRGGPALAELRALLSEVLTRGGTGDEIPESGRVGFRDHHQGDRHAASVTPSAEPAAGAVPEGRPLPPPGAPSWSTLPEPTRRALTGLVTRMLIARAGAEAVAPEGGDDDI